MKTPTERRLRDADPARGVDLDGASDAARGLRDAITGTAAIEPVGFDTSEIVLPTETRARRGCTAGTPWSRRRLRSSSSAPWPAR